MWMCERFMIRILLRSIRHGLNMSFWLFQHSISANQTKKTCALRFGELIQGLEAVEISNVMPDGRLRDAPDDNMMKIIRGNMYWHQDNTYMPLQAIGAVFSAKQMPTKQRGTAFADVRAAYDALDDKTKLLISNFSAHLSLAHSQAELGKETKADDSE